MNTELLSKLGSLAVTCVIAMILIVLACLVTPKLAKWIEKKNPELAEKIERDGIGKTSAEDYEAHSAFEASKEDDFDPNYKIYNEDIYAFNFGKKNKSEDKPKTPIEEDGSENKS